MKIESITKITVVIYREDILSCLNQHHSLRQINLVLNEQQLQEIFEKNSLTLTIAPKEDPVQEVSDLNLIFKKLLLVRSQQLKIFSQNVVEHCLMMYFEKSFSLLHQKHKDILYKYCSHFKEDGIKDLRYARDEKYIPSFTALGELYFADLKRGINTNNSDIIGKQNFTIESEVSFEQLGFPKSKALRTFFEINKHEQKFILGNFVRKFELAQKDNSLLKMEGVGPRLIEIVSIFNKLYSF